MTATLAPRMPSAPHCTPDCACDWQAHVFGSSDKFPLIHKMHYEAPLAPAQLYSEMLNPPTARTHDY